MKKGKKRVAMTLTAEPYERLQFLAKEGGFSQNWISLQVDDFLQGILPVMEQAYRDAKEKKVLTEEQAENRYTETARIAFEKLAKK